MFFFVFCFKSVLDLSRSGGAPICIWNKSPFLAMGFLFLEACGFLEEKPTSVVRALVLRPGGERMVL